MLINQLIEHLIDVYRHIQQYIRTHGDLEVGAKAEGLKLHQDNSAPWNFLYLIFVVPFDLT